MPSTWKRSQRRARSVKNVIDWRRSRARWQKKSAIGTTWKTWRCPQPEKEVSDVLVRPGKKSATCVIWGEISDGLNLKKKSAKDLCELAKSSSTSLTWKKISDERNIKKRERRTRPVKKYSAKGAPWKNNEPWTRANRKKNQRHA